MGGHLPGSAATAAIFVFLMAASISSSLVSTYFLASFMAPAGGATGAGVVEVAGVTAVLGAVEEGEEGEMVDFTAGVLEEGILSSDFKAATAAAVVLG